MVPCRFKKNSQIINLPGVDKKRPICANFCWRGNLDSNCCARELKKSP